jgi:hypothetical protein
MTERIPVGRVVATEQRPSTPHQFFFWTARDTAVGIGAIVRVEGDGRVVHGVVTDGMAWSDLSSALHAVLGADGIVVAVLIDGLDGIGGDTADAVGLQEESTDNPVSRRGVGPGAILSCE